MKVKAAIKKVKSYFAKQGVEIDVSCLVVAGHLFIMATSPRSWPTVPVPARMRWTERHKLSRAGVSDVS